MNKKGENFDPANPMAWVGLIVMTFVVIMILIAIQNAFCNTEKTEIQRLNGELDICRASVSTLNSSISQCDDKVKQISDSCNKRIENATKQCNENNKACFDFTIINKYIYIFYTFSLVIFISLSFSLFKSLFTFEISFGEKIDKFMEEYKTLFKVIRWILWSITLIFIIFVLIAISLTSFG